MCYMCSGYVTCGVWCICLVCVVCAYNMMHVWGCGVHGMVCVWYVSCVWCVHVCGVSVWCDVFGMSGVYVCM